MNHSEEAQLKKWLESPAVDRKTKEELSSLSEKELKAAMSGYMKFGTAGLRAKMGAGTAYMNEYTVAHATVGIAKLILSFG